MFNHILFSFIALSFVTSFALFANDDSQYTRDFQEEDCTFVAEGENRFFILKPGYQLVWEWEADGRGRSFS